MRTPRSAARRTASPTTRAFSSPSVEVVVREVERMLGAVDEVGDEPRDLARLLPAVRQSSDLDALAH